MAPLTWALEDEQKLNTGGEEDGGGGGAGKDNTSYALQSEWKCRPTNIMCYEMPEHSSQMQHHPFSRNVDVD